MSKSIHTDALVAGEAPEVACVDSCAGEDSVLIQFKTEYCAHYFIAKLQRHVRGNQISC